MAKQSARTTSNRSLKLHGADGDGNRISNHILLSLAHDESEKVFAALEYVRLNTHHVLHDAGDTVKSAYFCNSGLISVVSVFPDGKSVEVGLVGKEGFVGSPLVAGFRTAYTRAIVQVDATAFRVNAEKLSTLLRECPELERRLQQLSQIMAMETAQIAACNRVHEVEERLARWLLMCADRVDGTSLRLTQESMAQMLGTRRSSVTVAAGILQKAGLIHQSRGNIDIVSLPRLRQSACECYEIMERQRQRWQSEKHDSVEV